jgi:hypothetical protein
MYYIYNAREVCLLTSIRDVLKLHLVAKIQYFLSDSVMEF